MNLAPHGLESAIRPCPASPDDHAMNRPPQSQATARLSNGSALCVRRMNSNSACVQMRLMKIRLTFPKLRDFCSRRVVACRDHSQELVLLH